MTTAHLLYLGVALLAARAPCTDGMLASRDGAKLASTPRSDAVLVRARVVRDGELLLAPALRLRLGQSGTVTSTDDEQRWAWRVEVRRAERGAGYLVRGQLREGTTVHAEPAALVRAGTWAQVELSEGDHVWRIEIRVDAGP